MEQNLEQLKYPIGRFQRPEQYSSQTIQKAIAIIEAVPSWLDVCIENLDRVHLETPYRPDGWTIEQVVHHMADSHINAYVRLKLALTEDGPVINPYNENLWAQLPDVKNVPVNVSVTLLHALHRRWVSILNNMQPSDWERTYYHPDQQRYVPLWEMTELYAWHGRHHVEHIVNLRRRMNW
ncbi:MAG: putative metal-dependent hydrolase [Bacteroidota bacterium]